jgi:peroxiredoxin Q/BCP
MTLQIGDKAPDFKMPADGNKMIGLSDYKGKNLILYFYPKDDTSGCTAQACAFTENLSQFNKLDVSVIGVSKDSVAKHNKFKEKYNLTFPLISDENSTMCEDYGVWLEKSMYGKKYMGIERTTFLIDGNGHIKHIWNKVKVPNHIEDIISVINKK